MARAWTAGAGPGDGPLTVDVDSTICEVHGYHKQGACYGNTRRLGYHPLLATRASSGEVLHARLRKGAANTARGILRSCDELIARCRRAGASGELTLRMDAGFWSAKLIRRLRGHRVRYSVTVRQTKPIRAATMAIGEAAWLEIPYSSDGIAQLAETVYPGRPVDRAAGPQRRRPVAAAKTLRRTLLALPGRLTRSARRWTLHLPAGWPWAHGFTMALARLRCILHPT